MNLKDKFIIKKLESETILIDKNDNENIYSFDGVSKIIIDNYNKSKDYTINLLYKIYGIDKMNLSIDYDNIMNSINDLENIDLIIKEEKISEFSREVNNGGSCFIEITNCCNFRCDHCYVDKSDINHMSFNTFKYIVSKLKNAGYTNILLTGGEIFTNKDFIDMYKYAIKNDFIVSLNSNISLLNDKIIDIFKEYKPNKIEVSIYGYDNRSYEGFTHALNAFNLVDKNIKKLIDLGINISLKTTVTKRNKDYLDKLKKYAKDNNLEFRYDYIVFPKLVNNNKFEKNSEALSPIEIIDLIKCDNEDVEYFKKQANEVVKNKNNDNYSDNIFQCLIGKNQLFIDSYGYAKPCLVVPVKYNIYDYEIDEIKKEINKNLCSLKMNENSKCLNCYKRKMCRYCPGRFYLENGSYEIPIEDYCILSDLIIDSFSDYNK